MSQLNALSHENQDVRSKIDTSRRERLQMNQVFKKMQTDIKENIQKVSQLQKDTDKSRTEHEERHHRITALKKKLELERKEFKKKVKELRDEMQKEEQKELQEQVKRGKQQQEDTKNKTQSLKADEEDNFKSTAVMRRILKLAFLNTIQRRHIKQHQKNIEVFEQAFATIKSTTGISDIEEIVKIFIGLEQRNFSLLTYVNQLNREIETIEIRNRELQNQLSLQRQEQTQSAVRKDEALSELSVQIQKTNA